VGKSIAVIGVDPSSPFNHGSFLGDRVRMMSHFNKKDVFIRSMASRGSSGGLARKSQEVADIFDAAGYDYIFFETVGVGQIELDVMHATDTVVVVIVPESGDDIQMMKAGLMEIADIFVINKSDRAGVNRIFISLIQSLSLINYKDNGWEPPIQKTTATKMDGLSELVDLIGDHYKYLQNNNQMKMKSNERYSRIVKQSILEKSAELFWQQENEKKLNVELKKPIKHRIPPFELAEYLFEKGPQ
jgi:LAO/AO transport system kinase